MSYPADGGPRFITGSVSGYPMTPNTLVSRVDGRTGGKIGSVWYVYDRAYGHRIIAEYRCARGRGKGLQAQAETHAAELNAWDANA